MLLYKCFRFSEIMDQMFLTGRGGVQGYFRATLGVASVFIHDILRPGWGAWRCQMSPRRKINEVNGPRNKSQGHVMEGLSWTITMQGFKLEAITDAEKTKLRRKNQTST